MSLSNGRNGWIGALRSAAWATFSRFASKAKRGKHDFAFSGLIGCHACGCAVVGEIKKQRY